MFLGSLACICSPIYQGERIGHAAPTDVKDTNLQASTTASDVWYTLLRASSELVKARTKATDTAVSIYRALTAMAQQTAQLAYTSVRGKRQTSGIPPDEMVQLAAGWTAAGDESHGTAQVTSHNDEQDQDQDTSGETMGERSPCIRAAAEARFCVYIHIYISFCFFKYSVFFFFFQKRKAKGGVVMPNNVIVLICRENLQHTLHHV